MGRRWRLAPGEALVQDGGQEPAGQGEDGARTSPERRLCHVHGRGNNAGQMVSGPSRWTALGPGDDGARRWGRFGAVGGGLWDESERAD
jgi:hypothetical protein